MSLVITEQLPAIKRYYILQYLRFIVQIQSYILFYLAGRKEH